MCNISDNRIIFLQVAQPYEDIADQRKQCQFQHQIYILNMEKVDRHIFSNTYP